MGYRRVKNVRMAEATVSGSVRKTNGRRRANDTIVARGTRFENSTRCAARHAARPRNQRAAAVSLGAIRRKELCRARIPVDDGEDGQWIWLNRGDACSDDAITCAANECGVAGPRSRPLLSNRSVARKAASGYGAPATRRA